MMFIEIMVDIKLWYHKIIGVIKFDDVIKVGGHKNMMSKKQGGHKKRGSEKTGGEKKHHLIFGPPPSPPLPNDWCRHPIITMKNMIKFGVKPAFEASFFFNLFLWSLF